MNMNESTSVETKETQPEKDEARTAPRIWEPVPNPDVKREEAQVAAEGGDEAAALETAPPQYLSELSFVCVLIPRFSDHYLIGDITDHLAAWMKEICISYGWRLDAIAIRPGYMQWIIRVPLSVNPAQCMRITRRHTSERIFEEFPRFKHKNMSGEFWAPGNFVVAGNQYQTLEDVDAWILQTRRNQGIV